MRVSITRTGQPDQLLNRILTQPELTAQIQRLDSSVAAGLIRHIGLENSAEIISFLSTEQLIDIFDEELWYSDNPGEEEKFDASRFGKWLEIMVEAGPAFAARKVMELDEDLFTLALCRLAVVVDMDELALVMSDDGRSDEDDMLDKIVESSLNHEFDSYLVIARSQYCWESLLAVLVELNQIDYTTLNRILERCIAISADHIEESGGLLGLLSSEEMLEEDICSARESRRERAGFVTPSSAASFIKEIDLSALESITESENDDYLTEAYFRAHKAEYRMGHDSAGNIILSDTISDGEHIEKSGSKADSGHVTVEQFIDILQETDPLLSRGNIKLLQSYEQAEHHIPLAGSMKILSETDPELYYDRLIELGYLSNILISGCSLEGRRMRQVEAAEAALSICNLGEETIAALKPKDSNPEETEKQSQRMGGGETRFSSIREHNLVKMFKVGWKVLREKVVLFSAGSLINFLSRSAGQASGTSLKKAYNRAAALIESSIISGRSHAGGAGYDMIIDHLIQLQFDQADAVTVTSLIQQIPTMTDTIFKSAKSEDESDDESENQSENQSGEQSGRQSRFIFSYSHIELINSFIQSLH